MAPYLVIFAICMVINVIVTLLSSQVFLRCTFMLPCFASYRAAESTEENISLTDKNSEGKDQKAAHSSLLFRYLCVYLMATMSDWFQGPYVYALYSAYGFTQHDIAVLFVAGFGSSMIFGSFVGGMADSGGRKKYVIIFSITYAASCVTKHFNDYWVLMLGRLLGGVATSLLFSVFDSWLIKAHAEAKLDKSYISKSFSAAAYGNSIVAIVTGLIANEIASMSEMTPFADVLGKEFHVGGYLYPFDAALLVLILCGTVAQAIWTENYGDAKHAQDKSVSFLSALKNGWLTMVRNPEVMKCGLIASLFEGAMYIFVFMWTPMLTGLTEPDETGEINLPFGLIFATFMVCCMIGSSVFSILVAKTRVETIGLYVFGLGIFAMAAIARAPSDTMVFIGMNIFELCVGMYFPVMGTMKSAIVPEHQRSAIYNIFRIPLNFIVVTSLLTNLTPIQSFMVNTAMLLIAFILQMQLVSARSTTSQTNSTDESSHA